MTFRSIFAALAATALTACAQPPPMELSEAQEVMRRLGGGQTVEVCSPEGRVRLRSATRALSRAEAEQGRHWPDLAGAMDGREPDGAEVAALAALTAGVIEPSDVTGPARHMARMLDFAAGMQPDARVLRDGLRSACEDTMALHRLMVRAQLGAERRKRSVERARERGDHERAEELMRRAADDQEDIARDMERAVARITAQINAAKSK